DTEGQNVVVSEDGSHVYFVAHGVLTKTPNGQGESAQPGAENLYVFEHDAAYPAGRIAFVAQLSEEDLYLWGERPEVKVSGPDVTPDGRFLVLTSTRDLTSDDTSTARQVFEYDANETTQEKDEGTPSLVRVSIGQDGFNHNGNVTRGPVNVNRVALDDASIPTPFY